MGCALACTAALGIGCTAPVEAGTDAGSASRLSLVEVRAYHSASDSTLLRFDASARFVSVREPGVPADALDVLGLAWPSVSPGSCAPVDETPAAKAAFRVDLRDLSPVAMQVQGEDGAVSPLSLEPRAFPDVVGLVSGVVFVAPSAPLVSSAKTVSMQVGGGPSPVTLGFDLPDAPQLKFLNATQSGADATFNVDARGLDVAALELPRGEDRIALDVVRAGVTRARCVLDATGNLHVDALSLGGAGDATLLVRAQRRLQREDASLGPVEARLERDVEVHLVVR